MENFISRVIHIYSIPEQYLAWRKKIWNLHNISMIFRAGMPSALAMELAPSCTEQLHQPRLWFITGGYLVKCWFIPAAARARGQSNDLNWGILVSNLYNCHNEVINAPPIPSISRCIHIVYRHKNVWEYQRSNFIYNCMSTFLHYVRCKDALLDCSAPGGERCESLTWVDEIDTFPQRNICIVRACLVCTNDIKYITSIINHTICLK